MEELPENTCLSCLGAGEIASEWGPKRCPDCDGVGTIRSAFARNEQRIRQIESRSPKLTREAQLDMSWLVTQLRRQRDALVKIMTAAQDADAADELLTRIRFEANEALEMYSVSEQEKPKH